MSIINDSNIKLFVMDYITNNGYYLPKELKQLDIGDWDVRAVTDMHHLFFLGPIATHQTHLLEAAEMMRNFNEPLTNWDTSNVRNMAGMFLNCRLFNQPLNHFIVDNVEDLGDMFSNCESFNQPLDNWNVSRAKDLTYMFAGCKSFNQDLSGWDIFGLAENMFLDCPISARNKPPLGGQAVNVGGKKRKKSRKSRKSRKGRKSRKSRKSRIRY